MNDIINDEAVHRTAPATPGLLNITVQQWPNYSTIQWEETIPPILPNSGRPRRLRAAHLEDSAVGELCNCPAFLAKKEVGQTFVKYF